VITPEAHLLAVHASDEPGSVAVACAGRVEGREFAALGQCATTLLAAVETLLEELGIGLDDLQGLVVSTGPGSFTGIRVGLATAQGLAAARGWQVLASDSLASTAAACGRSGWPLGVVRDARRGEVYAALYDVGTMPPRPLAVPFCAGPAAAAARLGKALDAVHAGRGGRSTGAPSAPVRLRLVGSGADLVRPLLVERGLEVEIVSPGSVGCIACALLELAFAGGCRESAPEDLVPTYLRKSDAELRREQPKPGV